MKHFLRTIIVALLLRGASYEVQAAPLAITLARSPYDIGIHVGVHTTCSFAASSTLRTHNFTYPYIKSLIGCALLGAVKEEIIDDRASLREYGLNGIGIALGSYLSWYFRDSNFAVTVINPAVSKGLTVSYHFN